MNRKKPFLIAALALIELLLGAYLLYNRLEPEYAPEQLSTAQTAPPTEPETASAPDETTAAPMTAPDFTVYDLQGNPVNLSDFFGRPIVVNFWASWCGPCKMELPDFQAKYAERGEEIQFLLVNMTDGARETVETASGFLTEQGYTLPVYYDTEYSAAYAYGVNVLPCTYFIDAQGQPVAQATGAIDADTLQRGIDMISGT